MKESRPKECELCSWTGCSIRKGCYDVRTVVSRSRQACSIVSQVGVEAGQRLLKQATTGSYHVGRCLFTKTEGAAHEMARWRWRRSSGQKVKRNKEQMCRSEAGRMSVGCYCSLCWTVKVCHRRGCDKIVRSGLGFLGTFLALLNPQSFLVLVGRPGCLVHENRLIPIWLALQPKPSFSAGWQLPREGRYQSCTHQSHQSQAQNMILALHAQPPSSVHYERALLHGLESRNEHHFSQIINRHDQ